MNRYSLTARTYPVILVFMPILIIGIAYSIQFQEIQQTLASFGLTGALLYLFSNFGRDQGKKKESSLWASWGGIPTSQLLSVSDSRIDRITKKRYFETMSRLTRCPENGTLETMSKDDSSDVFRAWVKFLITHTRDIKQYPLIFKENISYGFRRNLWGLKPIGLVVAITCIIGIIIYHLINHELLLNIQSSLICGSLLSFLAVDVVIWIHVVTSNWVRIPAFAYAEQLLEAIDRIDVEDI